MAKKGQQVQLVAEVNTEEEWEKLLQREGLIIVDVYSDWCGPCTGMSPNLKKVKLEKGGDLLHLAAAKCDAIEDLKRFRNKSEPTWMFISNRKMVNLMFGTNAPKLVRLVEEELAKEKAMKDGHLTRDTFMEITDMAEEEVDRYERVQSKVRREREAEDTKRREELHMRRTQECNNILEAIPNIGVILVFPHAKDKVTEQLGEALMEAGLVFGPTEKVQLKQAQIDEMMYFAEDYAHFPPDTLELVLTPGVVTMVYQIKPDKKTVELEATIEEILQNIVYGKMMKPPGSPDSPAQNLFEELQIEDADTGVVVTQRFIGIWTPPNAFVCASAKKLFFPKITTNFLIPEPEPEPEYLAFVFDCLKRHEIMEIMKKYPKQIMKYGFFTSEDIESTELVAKTLKKYEQAKGRNFKEKMIIQVSRKKSECVFAFAQANPLYISPNSSEGKRQCKILFPEDYDAGEEPEDYTEYTSVMPDVMAYLDDQNAAEESEDEIDEEEEYDEGEEEEEGDFGEVDMFNLFD